jgi:mannose-6-phosphate isomerase-like protein (cupin superfamily)
MPIYTRETLQTARLPWIEIEDFETFFLNRVMISNGHQMTDDGSGHVPHWGWYQDNPMAFSREIVPTRPKDRIIVLSGEVQVTSEHGRFTLNRRDYYDIPAGGAKLVNAGESMAELARIQGHWDHTVRQEICMFDAANPCDVHYHDGDEFWIVFRGHFNIDYAGLKVPTRPGELLAFGKGYEHGIEELDEAMQAVVMAMPLEDRKRDGHLNREVHGEPVPGREIPESVFDELRAQSVVTT